MPRSTTSTKTKRTLTIRRTVATCALVATFLSGAACAFYYAYNQPFCQINLYPPLLQRQAHPMEVRSGPQVFLPVGPQDQGAGSSI